SEVTVVERGPRLIHREDEDVSENIKTILEGEGIKIRLGAECIGFEKRGDNVAVQVDCSSGDKAVIGSHTLLAVGRVPNTNDLGVENAGIKVDMRGYIQVDDQLRTNVPGIYALGDCNGRGAFTHTAYNDYEIVAANLLDGDQRRVSDRITAYALYIDPPLGRCGMTEAEVRKSGRKALVGKRPMTRVSRAIEKGETQGFMKIVVDAETREILGAGILGVGGDAAIHSVLDEFSVLKTRCLEHDVVSIPFALRPRGVDQRRPGSIHGSGGSVGIRQILVGFQYLNFVARHQFHAAVAAALSGAGCFLGDHPL